MKKGREQGLNLKDWDDRDETGVENKSLYLNIWDDRDDLMAGTVEMIKG
jgi:hypothetical protein